MAQVWNMFDGLPGVHPRIALDNPLLHTQRSGGWGGVRVVKPYGLGETINPANIVVSSGEIATAAIGGAVKAGMLGPLWATTAIPIIGAAVVGVAIAISLIVGRKGPKQKTATTHIVDDIEPQLEANVQGYIDGPRTPESQRQALENFKAGWQAVLDNCGDPSMGTPGQRCISERQEGAHPQWDACRNDPGGCPNWFQLYRDPILAHPPIIAAGPITVNSGTSNPSGGIVTGSGATEVANRITGTLTSNPIPTLLLVGGLAWLVMEK